MDSYEQDLTQRPMLLDCPSQRVGHLERFPCLQLLELVTCSLVYSKRPRGLVTGRNTVVHLDGWTVVAESACLAIDIDPLGPLTKDMNGIDFNSNGAFVCFRQGCLGFTETYEIWMCYPRHEGVWCEHLVAQLDNMFKLLRMKVVNL